VCEPDDACDANGLPDEDDAAEAGVEAWAEADVEAGADARAELPPDDVVLGLVEALLDDFWPVGEGVRVPW
jgi:hypothetical protein